MRLPTHAAIAAIASLAIQTAVAAQSANSEERFNRILTGVTKPGPSSAKRYYLCIFSRGYETRWSAGTTRLTISQLEKEWELGRSNVGGTNARCEMSSDYSNIEQVYVVARALPNSVSVSFNIDDKEPKGDLAEQPLEERVFDAAAGSASLAIDRRNGSAYGWAIDYKSLTASDRRSLAECNGRGRGCQVVLRFTGGCGAYAADQAKGSSVYGWGSAPTRAGAEERAWNEARQRGATNLVTRVWGCNSVKEPPAGSTTAGTGSPHGMTPAGEAESGPASALPGKGKLSNEVIRRNADAERAHQAQVDAYNQKLKDNAAALARSVKQRKAIDAVHQAELANAAAAHEQYERQRQAYREEYKRVTGHYPDE